MRKLALFGISFALASALYVYVLSPVYGLLLGGICAGAGILMCVFVKRRKGRYLLLLAGALAGFLWCSAYEQFYLQPIWEHAEQKETLTLTVAEYPSESRYGYDTVCVGTVADRPVRILVRHGESGESLRPGDRITITATLKKSIRDDGEETFRYYQAKGISLTASDQTPDQIVPCERTPLWGLPRMAAHWVGARISELYAGDVAPYLCALTTGDKSGFDSVTKEILSVAGISHTVAVSGMHVSILISFVMLLLPGFKPLRAVIGSAVVILFAVFTGGSPSVVRAAVMQIFMLFAPVFQREPDPPSSFGGALLLILFLNPWAAADVSFQLSFGALAGILMVAGKIQNALSTVPWIAKVLKLPILKKIAGFIISSGSVTLGASLFTVPIISLTFGSVSIYSILTNLLVLWALPICMIGAFLTVLIGTFWRLGAAVLAFPITGLVRYVLWVASAVARLPFASLSTESKYVVFWLIFVYLVLGVSYLFKEFKPFLVAFCCIAVSLAGVIGCLRMEHAGKRFEISALNVGQGQCLVMHTKAAAYMIDCGGSDAGEAGLTALQYLQAAGIRSLDGLILTHFDLDHVGGVPFLLNTFSVKRIYLPDVKDEFGRREQIEALAKERGAALIYVTESMSLPFEDGTANIFAPVSYYDSNAASLAVLYSVGDYDMLVTGDMDGLSEYDLMLKYDLPQVELYIAGHHGAKTSSCEELLSQICPEVVLISVGNNHYGHPSSEALDRFAQIGAEVYRTDQCGTITISR